MEQELRTLEKPEKKPLIRKAPANKPIRLQFDICGIGAVGFHRNLKQLGATVFTTSLYEINSLIQQRQEAALEELTDN